ncbi:GlcG/HbpS family heme-binding protein [Taklimakanibacter deserti]|uniref:GlcG/HbpS family heme-binding protein n=1 Tax=Taklimakanibacter deserti TaxID=2267839 RepID=UPI000E65B611
MSGLTLPVAQAIVAEAVSLARKLDLKPLAIVVLDDRGAVKAAATEDGTSLRRYDVAHGKAHGALALGLGSRSIGKRAREQPSFVAAVSHVVGGALVPVPGGVLLKNREGRLLGSVGASGDTSDNDERVVLGGIEAVGLVGDPGAD